MSIDQTFSDAYKAARVIETLENYVVADQIDDIDVGHSPNFGQLINHESEFWQKVFSGLNLPFDTGITLKHFTLSEWVPRVPGLMYHPSNKLDSNKFITWVDLDYPVLESLTLLNGIGTNLLPPENGYRIVSLSKEANVSSGIPVLIADAVWHKCSLHTDLIVSLLQVRWKRMAQNWSQRFESVRGLPRGYLVVEDETQIQVNGPQQGTVIYQPYTLIEYVLDHALVYDYLIREAESITPWEQIADEFEERRNRHYPQGRFLLNPDPTNPIFNAAYDSPEQLRRSESAGHYHIELLKERIRATYYSGKRTEDILRVLSLQYTSVASIDRIATYVQFPVVVFASNRPADRIAQLLDWCVKTTGKMEELIDKLIMEQPALLNM